VSFFEFLFGGFCEGDVYAADFLEVAESAVEIGRVGGPCGERGGACGQPEYAGGVG